MKLQPDTVYFVESPEDDTVLLAMDAKLGEYVEWFDSVRDRCFDVQDVEEDDDLLTVKTERATYGFRTLTVELYNERVIGMVSGHPSFGTTAEVQRFYRDYPR